MQGKHNKGFTLVELLITMLIVGIITGAILSAYRTMQRSYIAQDQVVEMQQNLRNAMDFMVQQIRMAGYDPEGKASTGIVVANRGKLQITTDVTGNLGTEDDGDGDHGDAGENLTFRFVPDINGNATDAGSDGIADAGVATFGYEDMNAANTYRDLAENVVAVEFNYILKDNSQTLTPLAGEMDQIRFVQISLLVRADVIDPDYTDTATYEFGSGADWGPFNDHYRRRLMITTVQCRNLGL